MAEYTYKDIIIDPTSEEAKNCIGKMVYYADNPNRCLNYANNDCFRGILDRMKCGTYAPFFIKGDNETSWVCIIPFEEELNSEYVPFKNVSEFMGTYRKIEAIKLKKENFYLSVRGIWLKYKATDTCLVVTEMWGNGLTIGSDTAVTRWNELLKYYEFLDGTPCGKLKEA